MPGGIYQITNQINGKRYVGSTRSLKKRRSRHFSALRRGEHHNRFLQRAFNKHGKAAFSFQVLEHTDSESLIEREQHYLDIFSPEYNISPTAGTCLGCHSSPETRQKISKALKGRPLSKEHRRNLSLALTGRHQGEQHRRKNSEAHKGIHPSEEARRKMSRARAGRRLSKEHKRRIAEGQQSRKKRQGCSSRYKGVSWSKVSQKWRARIKVNGECLYLGLFDDESEAAGAYNRAALEHFGRLALLNILGQSAGLQMPN